MNTASVPRHPADEQWENSDAISLSYIFDVLRRRWLAIVLTTLGAAALAAAAVLLYRQLTPPIYEAAATAVIVRTVTTVQFDERFTTTPEDVGAASGANVDSRRAALVALAGSGAIAQQVIDKLGDELPAELQNPTDLLQQVQVQMAATTGSTRQSDLISISARADSPELASLIANTWVEAYVEQVNSVYGQVPDDMLISVETQLTEAQAAYAQMQAQLENFLTSSPLNALTRQAQTIDTTIITLEQSKVDALASYMRSLVDSYAGIVQTYVTAQADAQVLAFDKTQQGEQARVAAYFDTYNAAQVDTFTTQRDRLLSELLMYNEQLLRTSSLLAAARTLQEQVASGEMDAANTTLALKVLNLQLVNAAAQATPAQVTPSQAAPAQVISPQALPAQAAPAQEGAAQAAAAQAAATQAAAAQAAAAQAAATQAAGTQVTANQVPSLQIQLDGSGVGAAPSAAELRSQVDAVVASLEGQAESMERSISQINQELLSGDSFADLNSAVPADSALVQAIGDAYPRLFQSNVLSATAYQVENSTLLADGQVQASQFLSLVEDSSLPTSDAPGAPMSATIAQLEEEQRVLEGQVEVESARLQQITQQRDLAWESVKALSNKQAELQLARATGSSEVRISGTAVALDVPPVSLLTSVALATAIGLLAGLVLAFVLEYMDVRPLRQAADGTAA